MLDSLKEGMQCAKQSVVERDAKIDKTKMHGKDLLEEDDSWQKGLKECQRRNDELVQQTAERLSVNLASATTSCLSSFLFGQVKHTSRVRVQLKTQRR